MPYFRSWHLSVFTYNCRNSIMSLIWATVLYNSITYYWHLINKVRKQKKTLKKGLKYVLRIAISFRYNLYANFNLTLSLILSSKCTIFFSGFLMFVKIIVSVLNVFIYTIPNLSSPSTVCLQALKIFASFTKSLWLKSLWCRLHNHSSHTNITKSKRTRPLSIYLIVLEFIA